MIQQAMEHRHIETNGVDLHVVLHGPADGRPVVLLHGFPEFWYGWRQQIEPLADAGYRVIVPDQRGYNLSAKPHGVRAYSLDVLANDILGLLDALGHDRASIVGHDWGGAVAWWLAKHHATRVDTLTILDSPHPRVFGRALRSPRQLLRSWYMFAFQLPGLAEWACRRDDFAPLANGLAGARQGAFTESDLALYRAAWSQPGALTTMLNWYRAAFRSRPRHGSRAAIVAPTLILWGKRDAYLGADMAQSSAAQCEHARVEIFDTASHWLQHDEPARVNAALLRHLAA